MIDLGKDVRYLKGVGGAMAAKLARLNIRDVGDLLTHYPRRYDDYSKTTPIKQIKPGLVTIHGQIMSIASRRAHTRRLSITEAILSDGTGTLKAVWFNQPYLAASFPPGSEVVASGKLEFKNNDLALQSPEIEAADKPRRNTGRIVPIYPETEGLSSKQLRGLIGPLALQAIDLPETLPQSVLTQYQLMSRAEAVAQIHFPSRLEKMQQARRRLAFEELFYLMLASLVIKNEIKTEAAPVIKFDEAVAKQFVSSLEFELTGAQRKAAWQILQDLAKDRPMNRLLEGDVGSGKTVVAALAAAMALSQGYQAALMVPTEILARQHFANLEPLFKQLGYNLELVLAKSKTPKSKPKPADLLIGTHALLSSDVKFKNLGLVVVDEQHRFGVNQRRILKQKAGRLPHLLTMTATPIPRTLALTVYGDLDISVIDQLPPGRLPVITKVVSDKDRQAVYRHIDALIGQGQQVFVVCPLIEASDSDTKSVEAEAARLQKTVFKHRRIGLMHGKLSSVEKQAVMSRFASGLIDILVSTTVVEVGIDIPRASLMIIESAERFGLASLHQLRGRIGRAGQQAHCYLVTEERTPAAAERLRAMEKTHDGFRLAQIDLEIRGPGQIYGLRQHGDLDLRLADINDAPLLAEVRQAASAFSQDPQIMVKYPLVLEQVNRLKAVTTLD